MGLYLRVVFLVTIFKFAYCTDPPCVIDLKCAECVPENMPLVTSHRAANGSVTAAAGDDLVLACGGGKFLAYPLQGTLRVACEAGRYRVRHDNKLRHLLHLGCQESIFEDVLHQVEGCDPPLQGRAYRVQGGVQGGGHLATLCFDADRAVALRLRMTSAPHNALPLAPHEDRSAPLSILGNFNHMFDSKTRHDADKLYSDDARTNRRVREAFKHDRVTFAAQTLTSAELLSGDYFEDQNLRVADFVSNRAAVWRSVAEGNLRSLHRDVAKLLRMSRPHALDVFAGTHGVFSLRTERGRAEMSLKPGDRFPVPRYLWTVIHARDLNRAVALILLNDPFVAVSEIREAVFCESACGRVSWLHELRRHRNYETPLYGLVFCCDLEHLVDTVPEMPRGLVNVTTGNGGLLTELF